MTKYDIECEILSCVLIKFEEYVDLFLSRLTREDFSDNRHRMLYDIFKKLTNDNIKTFEFTMVSSTYPKAFEQAGGVDYFVELLNCTATTLNFKSRIDSLLKMNAIEIINNIPKASEVLFKEDFYKGINFVEATLESVIDKCNKTEAVNLYDNFKKQLSEGEKVRINTGFSSLHKTMGFPHPGELMIVGARPGMGKTAFALQLLFNYVHSKNSKRAVMFSLEMSGNELFNRMISSVSGIPLNIIRSGDLSDKAKQVLDDNAKELSSNDRLSLYDKTVSTCSALRAALRKENKKGEVGLVIVDYLQLLTGPGTSPYERVSEISRQMKLIARDFNCCVIALSQLSRKVEDRADKHPQLSDLRESGSLEQDADYVLFLYRHNYYIKDPAINPKDEIVEIDVAKNRHGGTGSVPLNFDLTIGLFKDKKEAK